MATANNEVKYYYYADKQEDISQDAPITAFPMEVTIGSGLLSFRVMDNKVIEQTSLRAFAEKYDIYEADSTSYTKLSVSDNAAFLLSGGEVIQRDDSSIPHPTFKTFVDIFFEELSNLGSTKVATPIASNTSNIFETPESHTSQFLHTVTHSCNGKTRSAQVDLSSFHSCSILKKYESLLRSAPAENDEFWRIKRNGQSEDILDLDAFLKGMDADIADILEPHHMENKTISKRLDFGFIIDDEIESLRTKGFQVIKDFDNPEQMVVIIASTEQISDIELSTNLEYFQTACSENSITCQIRTPTPVLSPMVQTHLDVTSESGNTSQDMFSPGFTYGQVFANGEGWKSPDFNSGDLRPVMNVFSSESDSPGNSDKEEIECSHEKIYPDSPQETVTNPFALIVTDNEKVPEPSYIKWQDLSASSDEFSASFLWSCVTGNLPLDKIGAMAYLIGVSLLVVGMCGGAVLSAGVAAGIVGTGAGLMVAGSVTMLMTSKLSLFSSSAAQPEPILEVGCVVRPT